VGRKIVAHSDPENWTLTQGDEDYRV
jgi:hypothetical protein